MPRRSTIALTTLEAREVPAAGQFADIMPGAWGSYPHDFTTSGKTLFFAADNGHGDEVYASDGTAAGTHLVKDLSPAKRGSDPRNLTSAGNGVVFFTADDGAGRALYRSDGTAGGTAKVPGVPAAVLDPRFAVGLNGTLVFAAPKPGQLTPLPYQPAVWNLYVTGGGAPVVLATMDVEASTSILDRSFNPYVANGRAYFDAEQYWSYAIWSTDGTGAGTFAGRGNHDHEDAGEDTPVAEIAPGTWVTHFSRNKIGTETLYAIDAAGKRTELLHFEPTYDPQTGESVWPTSQILYKRPAENAAVGGKVFFTVQEGREEPEVWSTDGTAAGTKPVPSWGTGLQPSVIVGQFAGRALVADIQPGRYAYALTDGTAAGTTLVGRPAVTFGDGNWLPDYLGNLSPSAAYPDGLMVFSDGLGGVGVYVTDLTREGSRVIGPDGAPPNSVVNLPRALGRFGPVGDTAELNGSLYFAGPRTADGRPEPWKFDLAPAAVTPPVRPPVTATVTVNDGDKQRSTVTKITVAFDRAMLLTPGAFELRNTLTGKLVPLTMTTPRVGGATVLDLKFDGLPGGLADGTYTFTVRAAKVSAIGGGTLASDSVTTVTRLFGDLDGDGRYDRASRWMLHERVGAKRGDARYLAAFDVDGDGTVGAADELAVVRNWGKVL